VDELAALVTDPSVRTAALADEPTLPADFYDVAVPVPSGWDTGLDVHYLQLSPAYADAAAEARVRGWRVSEQSGGHLHLVNRPEDVAAALIAAAS
jgi:hypothetical protein